MHDQQIDVGALAHDFTAVKSAALLRALRRRATRLGLAHDERHGKGSHLIVRHDGRMTVVPSHSAGLPTGTFRGCLRQLGLTLADLEE